MLPDDFRGPFCGDTTVQNPPETCDDGPYNGGYGKCKVDCSAIGPKCGRVNNVSADDGPTEAAAPGRGH